VLDCPRKIGLTLNDSLLMSPSKSVTAIMVISKTKERLDSKSFYIENLYDDSPKAISITPQKKLTDNNLNNRKFRLIDYFDTDDYMGYLSLYNRSYFITQRSSIYFTANGLCDTVYVKPIFYKIDECVSTIYGLLFFKSDNLTINMRSDIDIINKSDIITNESFMKEAGDLIGMTYSEWLLKYHNISNYDHEIILRLQPRYYLIDNRLNEFILKSDDLICNYKF